MSLLTRTATSITWSASANLLSVAILFGRSIVLARLLPVKAFGTYALASSVVGISLIVAEFGMKDAFVHRAPETVDEEQAARTHFTLSLMFTAVWAVLLTLGTLLVADSSLRFALLVLVAAKGFEQLASTAETILVRRVEHRRLAVLTFLDAVLTTVVAVAAALLGADLHALLATDIASMVILLVGLYAWQPVWRPRLDPSRERIRYFLRFGRQSFAAAVLARLLDRLDDLWTGIALGQEPLGYYSRAYRFATYPRQILATPITRVAVGTYAELKHDRLRLSQAFFRTNALLVRTGFLLAGVLTLIAPEFIRIFIGEKWLPMLAAYRLMLVFTLFDPLKGNLGTLFISVGQPGQVVRTRVWQLLLLILGLVVLGRRLGIAGVALAVDVMLLTGIGLLIWRAREHVDFSIVKLFLPPAVSLCAALGMTYGVLLIPGVSGSDWRNMLVKPLLLISGYGAILILLERRQIVEMATELKSLLPNRWRTRVSDSDG